MAEERDAAVAMTKRKEKSEELICDEKRPGIEIIEYTGQSGYEGEKISLSNSLSNGLRFQILTDDGEDWACFHIHDPATALLLAGRLIEWSRRIADPPSVSGGKDSE